MLKGVKVRGTWRIERVTLTDLPEASMNGTKRAVTCAESPSSKKTRKNESVARERTLKSPPTNCADLDSQDLGGKAFMTTLSTRDKAAAGWTSHLSLPDSLHAADTTRPGHSQQPAATTGIEQPMSFMADNEPAQANGNAAEEVLDLGAVVNSLYRLEIKVSGLQDMLQQVFRSIKLQQVQIECQWLEQEKKRLELQRAALSNLTDSHDTRIQLIQKECPWHEQERLRMEVELSELIDRTESVNYPITLPVAPDEPCSTPINLGAYDPGSSPQYQESHLCLLQQPPQHQQHDRAHSPEPNARQQEQRELERVHSNDIKDYDMEQDDGQLTVHSAWDEFHGPITDANVANPKWLYNCGRRQTYVTRSRFIKLIKAKAAREHREVGDVLDSLDRMYKGRIIKYITSALMSEHH
ncbi:unnamed protein product [Mortierella alpina]